MVNNTDTSQDNSEGRCGSSMDNNQQFKASYSVLQDRIISNLSQHKRVS